MPKFSIILPVRNGGDYFRLCVQSILGQTLNDFNLLVLDNCSTDGCFEWVSSLNDQRIIIHRSERSLSIEENWGRVPAVSKSEFMTLIGHDDILSPHYLEEMNRLIEKHPDASLYQAHYKYIDKDGKVTRDCLPMDEVQTATEFLACQMNDTINSTGTGYMMRSRDFDKLGGIPTHYPNLIFADYELWIRLMEKSFKATTFAECFLYREHMSVSRITNGEQYELAFEKYIDFLLLFKNKNDKYSKVISRYGKRFLMKFCESLSHRLLKTSIDKRSKRVAGLVKKFETYASQLIPGQTFQPLSEPRIRYASMLDSNALTRGAFVAVRKLTR